MTTSFIRSSSKYAYAFLRGYVILWTPMFFGLSRTGDEGDCIISYFSCCFCKFVCICIRFTYIQFTLHFVYRQAFCFCALWFCLRVFAWIYTLFFERPCTLACRALVMKVIASYYISHVVFMNLHDEQHFNSTRAFQLFWEPSTMVQCYFAKISSAPFYRS